VIFDTIDKKWYLMYNDSVDGENGKIKIKVYVKILHAN